MLRKIVIVLVLALLLPGVALAQDENGPTPEMDRPYFTQADVIFPGAVRFDMAVERLAVGLVSITLTVNLPDAPAPLVTVVDPRTAAITDPFTALVLVWQIPPGVVPALFAEFSYEWRVVTTTDVVLEFGDTLVYSDPRVAWLVDEDPAGRISLVLPQDGPRPAAVRAALADVYELMADNTGRNPAFNLMLYPAGITPGCEQDANGQPAFFYTTAFFEVETLPCSPSLAESVYIRSGVRPVPFSTQDELQATVVGLMVETFYRPLWDDAAVPEWFVQGLAQFYLPGPQGDALSVLRQAARSGRLFSSGSMAALPEDAALLPLWRDQSAGMVLYIADLIGVPGLFALANNIGAAGSFAAAYQQATGQPLNVLLPAWESWLFRRTTEGVFAYSVYFVDTPVPTLTPSITPTRTPTEEPTATEFLSPTPRPSATPRPPTATVTPLPAGSFQFTLATPTPAPPPSIVPEGPAAPEAGLAVVGILLALAALVFVYLRMQSRRGA